jgi:hypothetical protein
MSKQSKFLIAITKNNTELISKLLQDSRVDPSDDDDWAIVLAFKFGHYDSIKILLEDKRTNPSNRNNVPLQLASFFPEEKFIKLLLNDPRVNPIHDNNYAITNANKNKNINTVKILWNLQCVKDTLSNDNNDLYNKLIQEDFKNKIKHF